MAEFLSDSQLPARIEKIIADAQEIIWIISPFIKLHSRLRDKLASKSTDEFVKLRVLFGKNSDDPSKSISKDDLELFKRFQDVSIHYNDRLHAKYYANENEAVLTSMNLYEFSVNNNIEFGIAVNQSRKDNQLDQPATSYFKEVFENSPIIFEKEALFAKKGLIFKSDVFTESIVKIDTIDEFIATKGRIPSSSKSVSHPSNNNQKSNHYGYCIRIGVPIMYNPKRPFSYEAYQEWAKYNNADHPESYCHFTGEPSNGKNSQRFPILKKNYSKAKAYEKNLESNRKS